MTFDAKDVQDAVKALAEAVGPKNDWLEALKTLAWPVVVALGLWGFRAPLSRFVAALGERMTKVALFHVEIELASVATQPLALPDLVSIAGDDVTGGTFTPTTIMELLNRINEDAPPSFLLVDIGDGARWLTSRLYLFSFVLWRIGAIRAVVFVETKARHARRLLGIAWPDRVCAALGEKYAWFGTALAESWVGARGWLGPRAAPLARSAAEMLVQAFKMQVQDTNRRLSSEGWMLLPSSQPPIWERTKWIDRKTFDDDLRAICFDREESRLVDSPDAPAAARNRGLLRRRAPFIALVNSSGELKCLVEREAFVECVAAYVATELDASVRVARGERGDERS